MKSSLVNGKPVEGQGPDYYSSGGSSSSSSKIITEGAEGEKKEKEKEKAAAHDGVEKCERDTMDADLWSGMPEELLEKIIARLPLRFLFQSRALSKSWESKMDCGSFQNEVSLAATSTSTTRGPSSSSAWKSYCPLYVGRDGLIGYDITTKRSEQLLTLSYLPCHPRAALITNTRGKISGAGTLMCFVDCDYFPNVYVTNVITRKWKILPTRPDMTYPAIVHLVQVPPVPVPAAPSSPGNRDRSSSSTRSGPGSYKVILITPQEPPCSQIYDSATNKWSIRYADTAPLSANLPLPVAGSRWASSNRAWISSNNAWTNSAFFQGVLYVLWGYQYDGPCELLAYALKEGSWMNIRIQELRPSLEPFGFVSMSRVLVCADSVMIVIRLNLSRTAASSSSSSSSSPATPRLSTAREEDGGGLSSSPGGCRSGFVHGGAAGAGAGGTAKENLVVFRLDSESRQIDEISRGPSVALADTDLNEAASDGEGGDNIYFYQKLAPNSSIVVYDVRKNAWSCLSPAFNVDKFHAALKKRNQPQSDFFFQPTTFSFQPGQNPFIPV